MDNPNNNNRTGAIQQLAAQLPVANSRVAQQQQAARNIQLQQAVGAAPTTAPVGQVAGQVAAAQQQTAGQQAINSTTQQVQQQGQLGQMALGAQAQQDKQDQVQRQLGEGEKQLQREQQLAQISRDGKQELYDKQMEFARDQMGREYLNQTQLDDWALMKARSQEDLENYSQQVQQLSQRNLQVLDTKYKLLSQEMQQQAALRQQLANTAQNTRLTAEQKAAVRDAQQKLDQASFAAQKEISAVEQAIRDKQIAAANKQARNSAIGSVIGGIGGAVAGSFAGNPVMGAAIGAQGGAAVGSGLAGLINRG